MRRRIVMVAEGIVDGIGGIAMHVNWLTRALRKRGNDVFVFSPEQYVERRNLTKWKAYDAPLGPEPPIMIRVAPLIWSPRRILRDWQIGSRLVPQLREFLTTNDAQLLHWHGIDADNETTRRLAKHIPRVFTNHSSQFLELEACDAAGLSERFLNHADRIIAPSRELAEKTVSAGFPPSRVHYVPNGVDIDVFKPDPAARAQVRDAIGVPREAVVAVCARRLVPKNGVMDLMEALDRLDRLSGEPLFFLIAGNGRGGQAEYERAVMRRVKNLGARVQPIVLGWRDPEQMRKILAASDISILPSLREATSLSGLEAMASGCVVVGTNVGGIPELITDGEHGLLVPAGDAGAMMAALEEVIDNQDLRSRLTTNARRRVEESYSWDVVAQRTEEVYDSLFTRQ